jgi:hypothetical protein
VKEFKTHRAAVDFDTGLENSFVFSAIDNIVLPQRMRNWFYDAHVE